jgi:hypothetical protein
MRLNSSSQRAAAMTAWVPRFKARSQPRQQLLKLLSVALQVGAVSLTNDSSDSDDNLGPRHGGKRGQRECWGSVPCARDVLEGVSRASSGCHLHSSLQRPASGLKGTMAGPVKLARAERTLGVWGQHPRPGPIQSKTQPVHHLRN